MRRYWNSKVFAKKSKESFDTRIVEKVKKVSALGQKKFLIKTWIQKQLESRKTGTSKRPRGLVTKGGDELKQNM